MRPGVAARLQGARLSREEKTLVLLYIATWHGKVLGDALDHVLGVRRRRDGARRVNKPGNRKGAHPGELTPGG